MDIQSVALTKSIPITNLVKARYSPGKIALPVKNSQYLYSNLKHVHGIPAPNQNSGYSLMKLQALDNLIDRLGELGKKPADVPRQQAFSEGTLNTLINEYASDLHQLAANPNPYRNISVEPGLLINVSI